jgi:hypothetical protein
MNKITNKNKSISNGTRKGIFLILLIIFLVFISVNIVHASLSLRKFFGGKITSPKATEIKEAEAAGYKCPMSGTSISIIPKGSPSGTPTSFFIPSSVTPVTRTTPTTDQQILGIYSESIENIMCKRPSPEDPEIEEKLTIGLKIMTLFGTSRR